MDLTSVVLLLVFVCMLLMDMVQTRTFIFLPRQLHPCIRKCNIDASGLSDPGPEHTQWNITRLPSIFPFCYMYEQAVAEGACNSARNATNCYKRCPSGTISNEMQGVYESIAEEQCSQLPKLKAMNEKDRKCITDRCNSTFIECNSTCTSAADDALAKEKPTQESDEERLMRRGCDLLLCGFDCAVNQMKAGCGSVAEFSLLAGKRELELNCGKNPAVKNPDGRGGGGNEIRSNAGWVIAMITINFLKA